MKSYLNHRLTRSRTIQVQFPIHNAEIDIVNIYFIFFQLRDNLLKKENSGTYKVTGQLAQVE